MPTDSETLALIVKNWQVFVGGEMIGDRRLSELATPLALRSGTLYIISGHQGATTWLNSGALLAKLRGPHPSVLQVRAEDGNSAIVLMAQALRGQMHGI